VSQANGGFLHVEAAVEVARRCEYNRLGLDRLWGPTLAADGALAIPENGRSGSSKAAHIIGRSRGSQRQTWLGAR